MARACNWNDPLSIHSNSTLVFKNINLLLSMERVLFRHFAPLWVFGKPAGETHVTGKSPFRSCQTGACKCDSLHLYAHKNTHPHTLTRVRFSRAENKTKDSHFLSCMLLRRVCVCVCIREWYISTSCLRNNMALGGKFERREHTREPVSDKESGFLIVLVSGCETSRFDRGYAADRTACFEGKFSIVITLGVQLQSAAQSSC